MSDPEQDLHARTRRVIDELAELWLIHAGRRPGEGLDAWFGEIRRMVEARAGSVARVDVLGPMGGGGADEA